MLVPYAPPADCNGMVYETELAQCLVISASQLDDELSRGLCQLESVMLLRKLLVATAIVSILLLGLAAIAFAANPGTQGPPSKTCLNPGATQEPGNAAGSPGSPFNEVNGIGGSNYSPKSQYDVACFQVTSNHP
jgi:hypothetical protein